MIYLLSGRGDQVDHPDDCVGGEVDWPNDWVGSWRGKIDWPDDWAGCQVEVEWTDDWVGSREGIIDWPYDWVGSRRGEVDRFSWCGVDHALEEGGLVVYRETRRRVKGDVCFFTLLHYPLWRPHFFFYPNDLLTQFSILPWQEIKKKFFLKIFIFFLRIFKKIFFFSRFFPYKMGNYQRIFDFSIREALYRSLPYILKKSWKNI